MIESKGRITAYAHLIIVIAVAWGLPGSRAEGAESGASKFERQVLKLTNKARASGATCGGKYRPPAPPLVWNKGLAKAAKKWSRHLSSTGKLSHNRLRERIKAVGLKVCRGRYAWGENVAYNASAAKVVAAWLRSASHCRNIMNPSYRLIGVGMIQKGRRQYYTQLFHSRINC